jgi:hypothetical protein
MRTMDMKNLPHVVLEILDAGKPSGTWLFSPMLEAQDLEGPHAKWRGALRAERYYHPFSVKLLTTTHEKYQGTEIPKNFQSRVLLENTQKGEKREVDISMNNPLRYDGLTFYQHQMGRTEPSGGKGNSQLQVVRNPGWITPYLGCIIEALRKEAGLAWLWHRNDATFAEREGYAAMDEAAFGEAPEELWVHELGLRYIWSPRSQQKTGHYCDQRENRAWFAELAKGARVFDAFCFSGGFGLAAARAGALSVLGVDSSEGAVAAARRNAAAISR